MLKYRKYYYTLSSVLVVASIISLAVVGLNFGIDFTGGGVMEVNFKSERPNHEQVRVALADVDLGETIIQDIGPSGLILRFKNIDEAVHQEALNKFEGLGEFEELRFESIGPVIGAETKRKSIWAILLVLVAILVYIAWAFRRISFPLKSWKYGIVALITLFHDVLITVGVFSIISHFLGIEIGVPFVAALLTIFGYSVNDTIVIFDRIRENVLRQGSTFDFAEVINKSVRQTYVRSLNTSLTTLFVLLAIFLFGGITIKYFVLALIIGVSVGTYSSLFLASPLLFSWSVVKLNKSSFRRPAKEARRN